MSEILWSRRLDRRQLLRYGGGAALAVAGGPLIAACGGSGEDERGADAARKGDSNATLVYGSANTYPHFDPATSSSLGGLVGILHLYEAPTTVNAEGGADPLMITGLPERVGPNQMEITLLPNLVFHDGTPVRASDVAFTIERIQDPATASIVAPAFRFVEKIATQGDTKVRFTLTQEYDYFPLTLALAKIVPEKAFSGSGGENFGQNPMGSGPFQFVSLNPTAGFELKRFDGYRGKQAKALIAGLKSEYVADDAARVAQLRSGNFHVIEQLPYRDFEALQAESGIKVGETLGSRQSNMEFEHSKPPFNDVRVRQAFMYALDRDRIAELVFRGHAEPAHSMLPPDSPYYVDPRTKYDHNPERARALLADAGYANGVDFEMMVGTVDWLRRSGELMKEMLEEVGMRPKIKLTEVEAGYGPVVEGKYQCYLSYYNVALFTDPLDFYYRFSLYGDNRKAFFRWDDDVAKRVDRLIDQAYLAGSVEARTESYGQAQELISQHVPGSVPINQIANIGAWRDNIHGYEPPADDLVDFRAVSVS